MPVVIREANGNDIGQICQLEQMCFFPDRKLEEIECQINLNDTYYFVAETEKKIIGYLSAKAVLDEVDLWYIAVETKYRKKNIGNRLMEKFMNTMKVRGMQTITLEVRKSNENALRLYKKHNFKEISIRKDYYKNPVEDAIILQYLINEMIYNN